MGWIGVDLDGTLAEYHGWKGADQIGAPIPAMVERVKDMLAHDCDVRIFTARVSAESRPPAEVRFVRTVIESWCEQHIGRKLPVTCCKDFSMITLYDDRCVAVEHNTGRLLSPDPMQG